MTKHKTAAKKGKAVSGNGETSNKNIKQNIGRNAKLWLLMSSSAILLSIPFLYPHLGLVSLIAFVPLLAAEQIATESGKKYFFAYYYSCFLLWNLATTYWIYNATVPGMIAAVVLNALQMAIVFRLFRWMRTVTKGFLPYLFLIATWLAWEHAYFNWEVSWPWLVLGNSFATSIKSIQWYEYTGTLGGSLWILLTNMLFFRYMQRLLVSRQANRQNIVYGASLVLLVAVPLIISQMIFHTYEEVKYEPSGRESRVEEGVVSTEKNGSRVFSVLQPNIDPYKDKFTKSQSVQTMKLTELAIEALTETTPDFIIAPETFMSRPPLIVENEPFANPFYMLMHKFSRLCNVYADTPHLIDVDSGYDSLPGGHNANINFIFGAVTDNFYYDYQPREDKNGKMIPPTLTARYAPGFGLWYDRSNTAVFIDSKGENEFYHKSKLVVLVESTPYKKLFNLMSHFEIDLGGAIGSYAPQLEREVFTTPDSVKIGTAICYESVYGDYYREYILKGANVMSIITNDGWWGDTPGYHQHLSYASLRAIETRRAIARSANTGISALINQRGEIMAQTGWWEPAYLTGRLNLNDEITVFVKYGDIIGRLSGFIFFLFALMGVVRTISRKYISTAN